MRIILDTDLAMGAPGSDVDDGFALALAHADPGISLELITTVNGNTDV
jgi:purine nucleosidase